MKPFHPALIFAGVLLAMLCIGCGKKNNSTVTANAVAPPEPVVPAAEIVVEGVPVEDQPALKTLLRVDGVIKRGDEYVVALNGQVVKAGEFLRLTIRNTIYILEVMNITSQRIRLKATKKDGENVPPASSNPAPDAVETGMPKL